MSKIKTGRVLVTLAVALSGIVSTIVDILPGDKGHVDNSQWLPHAKFHDAVAFIFLDGICLLSLWLMWRKSKEPKLGMIAGVATVSIFWSSFYYITFLFPEASLIATNSMVPLNAANYGQWPEAVKKLNPMLFGFLPLYINTAIGTALIIIALIGLWMYKKGVKVGNLDNRLQLV